VRISGHGAYAPISDEEVVITRHEMRAIFGWGSSKSVWNRSRAKLDHL
jgi:hypothetical protein